MLRVILSKVSNFQVNKLREISKKPLLLLDDIRMTLIALGDGLVSVERMHRSLVLLGHIRALVGVLVVEEEDEADGGGHEHRQAHAENGGVAPVLERRRVHPRKLDDLDVTVRRDLDGLGRVRDRVDGAVPLANARAVDHDVRVGHLEKGVLEREDAIELEATDAADEAHVGAHGLVAADVQEARRVEDHVDVGATREIERIRL